MMGIFQVVKYKKEHSMQGFGKYKHQGMPIEETGSNWAGITSSRLFSRSFESVLSPKNRIELTKHVLLESWLNRDKNNPINEITISV